MQFIGNNRRLILRHFIGIAQQQTYVKIVREAPIVGFTAISGYVVLSIKYCPHHAEVELLYYYL